MNKVIAESRLRINTAASGDTALVAPQAKAMLQHVLGG